MLRSLQAGRALAAVGVAAFHLSIMMGAARYGGDAVFGDYTWFGDRGVDFFFVLSGFIIAFAHAEDIGHPTAWGGYAYRRFVRLFPIYWTYTLVFTAAVLLFGSVDAKVPGNFADWLTSLTLIRFTAGTPPLEQAWTLFHEIAFYAAFSLLIVSRRLGLVFFGAVAILSLLLYHFPPVDGRTALSVYTSAYNLYFMLGMGAFWLYRRGGAGIIELILGLMAIVASVVTAPPRHLTSEWLVVGFALTLAGLTKLESSGRLDVPRHLALIGDASYTIYLIHVNVEGLLLKVSARSHLAGLLGPAANFLFVLLGTTAVGVAAYLLVERPLLDAMRRRRRPARAAS